MISYALTQNNNAVKLITGNYYKEKRVRTNKRVLVLDLDETIGHFHHLNLIYKCLVEVLQRELTQEEFNQLLDLFPEFFRPGIMTIFDFLFDKKRRSLSLQTLYLHQQPMQRELGENDCGLYSVEGQWRGCSL